MSQQNNQPIKKMRCNNISAAIFANEIEKDNEKHIRFSVQIQKQFRRDDGSWQVTNVFFPKELNPKFQSEAQHFYPLHNTSWGVR